MKRKPMTKDVLELEIQETECLVRIDTYHRQPAFGGSPLNCPSADDYYGYEEIEYTVLNEFGEEFPWLEQRMTAEDDEYVLDQISNFYEERFDE